jgi:hypothetical protein
LNLEKELQPTEGIRDVGEAFRKVCIITVRAGAYAVKPP